jgi:Terminase large subunit, T4likevirus-type, N-terminal
MNIAGDIARMLDPVLFALDCGIECDPWQAEVLRLQPRRTLLLCSRQAGKSTVSALLGLWTAIYQPNALVLFVSPSLRQSGELFRTCMQFYQRLEDAPELIAESALRAQLANGSRIVSLPGSEKTTRGFSKATLIVVDEAARVEDALMAALRPMLATSEGGGKLVMLSTPAGTRGAFYEYWSSGRDDWHRVEVPASSCPRISKEFLDEELRQLGQMKFDEEYGLVWLDPEESVFPIAIVESAFTPEVVPLWA